MRANSLVFTVCKQATLRTKVPASGKCELEIKTKLVTFIRVRNPGVMMCRQYDLCKRGSGQRYCCFRWCIVTTVTCAAQVMKCPAKQLWEAFHPSPASSGRSSSTVVGQMRNTPLSSLGCQQRVDCRLELGTTVVVIFTESQSERVPPVQPLGYCDVLQHLKV